MLPNRLNQKIHFRNYTPLDEDMKKLVREKPQVYNIAKEISARLEKVAKEEPDFSTITIAPKKANWDLKRDLERKLERLDSKTQRVIVELMRDKLQSTGSDEDLIKTISMQSSKDMQESDSEKED